MELITSDAHAGLKEARKAWLTVRHSRVLATAEEREVYALIDPLIAAENALLRARRAKA